MATIKDIAKALNIGVSTVSMALNDHPKISNETKKLVNSKATELRYQRNGIAMDLQKRSTNIILLVTEDASRPFFAEVIGYIQEEIANFDYNLIVSTTFKGHSQTAKKLISEKRVDGAIIITDQISDDFIINNADINLPIFLMGRHLKHDNVYSFSFSEKEEGYDITQFLINKGHRRIAYVLSKGPGLGSKRRFEGYKKCLLENGIEFNKDLIFESDEKNFSAGYMITHSKIIPSIHNIDAVFYSNDELAIGGINAFKDENIDVPNDISLVGHGNIRIACLVNPALTTVETGKDLHCKYAVEVLIDAVKTKNEKLIRRRYEKKLNSYDSFICERETVKERS